MTKEQAELVYGAVANDEQVNLLAVNSRVDELSEVVNPYTVGLRTNTDSTLKKEPFLEMKKCDLTWSILSTVVDYTGNDKDSPHKEINYSPIYNHIFGVRDLRMSLVIYIVVTSLMTLMMLVLPIWDITNPKVKRELFQ